MDFLGVDFQPAEAAAEGEDAVFLEALEAVGVSASKDDGMNGDFQTDGALVPAVIDQLRELFLPGLL
jgi:hypothetical protein